MKNMPKILHVIPFLNTIKYFLIVLAITISTSNLAQAEPVWVSGTFHVDELETATGGWTWVHLDRAHGQLGLCGSNHNRVILGIQGRDADGERGYASNLKILTAALLTNKQIRIRIDRVETANYCFLERATLIRAE